MNALRNKVSLIGHLGAKPEFTKTQSGQSLARFSIAINDSYKNKAGEYVKQTQWHQVKAWGKLADLVNDVLDKGSEVVLEGRLQNESFETAKGEKRYSTSILLNEFIDMSKKK